MKQLLLKGTTVVFVDWANDQMKCHCDALRSNFRFTFPLLRQERARVSYEVWRDNRECKSLKIASLTSDSFSMTNLF